MAIRSSPSDRIEDFIEFFQQIAGREATAGRIGASQDEIDHLQSICRFSLPTLYKGYLREFGRDEAMLNFSQDGYPHIDDLIRFHEGQTRRDYQDAPKNSVVIALEGIAEGKLLLYSDNPNDEPKVMAFYDTTIRHVESSSFRNYLYTTAFICARFPLTRKTDVYLRGLGSRLTRPLTEFSVKLGFIPYWFCDDCGASLERGNDYLHIAEYGDRTYLALNGADRDKCQELRAAFMGNFPLEDVGISR